MSLSWHNQLAESEKSDGFNPDIELEESWPNEENWVDDPHTAGLKTEVCRFSQFKSSIEELTYTMEACEWKIYDYIEILEEREPAPKPRRKQPIHNKYSHKNNYSKNNQRKNFNHRRR